ncbi:Glycosyl transferase family 2 [Ruminococcus flavefaciens]|uniref:Glycosyl transferase family 2 n=1 Tax=Ruminococcus flavefaciens TaxID=1265 RepID=A0A1H6ICK3_RUMFL|nr:glycosyltransferase [Ruminococcus flavefaciens]SEH46542.1 Glycosyl transferase family 2 [Ruminococcus flavefaciens]
MNNNPLISVVVPVYNTEISKFESMLSTIRKQPQELFELIIVDDGSNSEVATYLDSIPEVMNTEVIHQHNKGLAGARNTGIKAAKGQYTVFVDADDAVSNNFFISVKKYTEKYNPDVIYSKMVLCKEVPEGYQKLTKNNCSGNDYIFYCKAMKQNAKNVFYYNKLNELQEMKMRILDYPSNRDYIILGSACATVYRTSIIKEHLFDEDVRICEDQVFNRQLLQHISNCLVVPDEWYYYIQYSSSMLHDQGKSVDINKTITYWNSLFEIDRNENAVIQSISNTHNILLLCDDIRNITLSEDKFLVSLKKVRMLLGNKLIRKAIKGKCVCDSRSERIKVILIKCHMHMLLMLAYKIRGMLVK